MDKKKFTDTGDGAIRVTAQYDGTSLNKNGYTPPQEKKKDLMIDKPTASSEFDKAFHETEKPEGKSSFVHEYDEDGKLKPGYPRYKADYE